MSQTDYIISRALGREKPKSGRLRQMFAQTQARRHSPAAEQMEELIRKVAR